MINTDSIQHLFIPLTDTFRDIIWEAADVDI